jgi:general secretion pathway protein F
MQKPVLSYQARAIFFRRLASLEHAGIDTLKSLSSLADKKEKLLASKCRITANKIKKGMAFHQAALQAGLLDQLESTIIKTAQYSGTTDYIYNSLAKQYEDKSKQARLLKSRLMLPMGILLLAGFIAPLPLLITGKIAMLDYLLRGIGFALMILGIMLLLLKIPLLIRRASIADNGFTAFIDTLLLNLPTIRHWYIKKHTSQWLELAALVLASGVSAHQAIPLVNSTLSSLSIRGSFESVNHALLDGQTLFESIKDNPYLATETKHFINSGEAAGRLDEMLKHSADLEKSRLQLHEQQLLEWLPRIIYFLALSWLAASIIS